MGAQVKYAVKEGTSVPYPPVFDDIRNNFGYIDTRGRPERVDDIPECEGSNALRSLLLNLAAPGSGLISLGCDLGLRFFPKKRLSLRFVVGGYVQVMAADQEEQGVPILQRLAKAIEVAVLDTSGKDRWEIELVLAPVLLKFEEEIMVQSIWVWLHAKASKEDKAIASRERLLEVLSNVIQSFNARLSG